jgi:hypothetical protein
MELIIKSIRTYYRGVIGCKRHNRDIMIAFTHEAETEPNAVHDLFLTQEQAVDLLNDLKKSLGQNAIDSENAQDQTREPKTSI